MMGYGPGLPIGLALLFASLCAAIGLEIVNLLVSQPADRPVRAIAPLRTDSATNTEPPIQLDASLNQVLARPLFSPDRRPVASAVQTVRGLPRLTGIVITDSRQFAIFAAPAGGHVTVVEVGARVGSYEVRAITDTGVTLTGPEGTTLLRPIFDPTPTLAAKPLPLVRPELPRPVAR
ncbi:MAG: hypothetical protein ABSC06_30490 [Rhodopila sp.]|jgi:general secretion pathway protein N